MIEQKELPYTYVFIRSDLSYAQQIVQASHATLEAGFKFDQPAEISRIVLFPLNNEKQLFDRARHLRENGIEHVMFYEPDIEQYTAISTAPIFGADREALMEFSTYRAEADKKWPKRMMKFLRLFQKR
jgi:hypothetical protein